MSEEKAIRLRSIGLELNEELMVKKRGRPRKVDDGSGDSDGDDSIDSSDHDDNGSGPYDSNAPPRKKWLDMLQKLKEYSETKGTFKVSSDEKSSKEHGKLGRWIKNQRRWYRSWTQGREDSRMNQQKYDLLTEIGFDFTRTKKVSSAPPRQQWLDMLQKLKGGL